MQFKSKKKKFDQLKKEVEEKQKPLLESYKVDILEISQRSYFFFLLGTEAA